MELHRIWHLLGRKLAGEATLDELRELEKLLEKIPAEAYGIDIVTEYLNQLSIKDQAQDQEGIGTAWHSHYNRMQQKQETGFATQTMRPVPRFQKRWLAAAAVIFLVAFAGGWWLVSKPSNKASLSNANNNRVYTQPGSRSKLVLPDGTTVWLNSDSRITYNEEFGKEKREVELVGEAFFDVAHNPRVPMVVHARSVNIVVKGTAFNVKAYPNEKKVETALIRGLVELSTRSDPERKILLRPREKISIQVEEEQSQQKNKRQTPAKTGIKLYELEPLNVEATSNLIPEVSWTQNKLVFDNEPFSEVVKKMERWYNVRIDIKDEQLAERKLSGAFEKENLEQALKLLQLLGRFRYEIKENTVLIYKK
jgi:transmembrane sensor